MDISIDRLNFEQALERLESLVRNLEAGDTGLEESLHLFEDGVRLSRHCLGILDSARGRVEILLQDTELGSVAETVPLREA